MSVLEELTGLEEKVRARLTELRPLLDEYAELERAAKRLGIAADGDAPAPSPRRAGGSRRRAPSAHRSPVAEAVVTPAEAEQAMPPSAARPSAAASEKPRRATAGSPVQRPGQPGAGPRAEQLAELVRQRPGLTVKDAGAALGADPTSLYRVVKRMERDGTLRKDGRELHPA